jgi:hypothetical protein
VKGILGVIAAYDQEQRDVIAEQAAEIARLQDESTRLAGQLADYVGTVDRMKLDLILAGALVKPGTEKIHLLECTKCGCITINPTSDHCACGCEFYPTSKSVAPGTRIKGVSLDHVIPPPPPPGGAVDSTLEGA